MLGDFSKSDRDWVERTVDAIAEAAAILLQGDDAAFTTKVALILKPAKKSEAKRAKDTDHEDQK